VQAGMARWVKMIKKWNNLTDLSARYADGENVRAHLFIDGRVQGVGYRYFAAHVAAYLGLAGWVRNLPDRGVEVVFEGNRQKIEQAIQLCYEGPPFARVTNIEIIWHEQPEGLTDFQINH
jgi:acylphosphatase